MVAAPDTQLYQSASQTGIDGSHFFVIKLVAKSGCGTLTGFFDFNFIDVFNPNGHIRHDEHTVGCLLHNSPGPGQQIISPAPVAS
jgi:hypothetical protein